MNSHGTRIVGGQEVNENKYTWHVLLNIYKSKRKYICGGSIISEYIVLTAAHCVTDNNGR